jgi:hypothetical protein
LFLRTQGQRVRLSGRREAGRGRTRRLHVEHQRRRALGERDERREIALLGHGFQHGDRGRAEPEEADAHDVRERRHRSKRLAAGDVGDPHGSFAPSALAASRRQIRPIHSSSPVVSQGT